MRAQLGEELDRLEEHLGSLPEPMTKPPFIVVSGLPGTGKSYFCHQLREKLPAVIVESDSLRKVLFPQPSYSAEESFHLFQILHRLAGDLLKKGIPVIFDATNLEEKNREYLYSIAERQGAKLILVQIIAPAEVVKERLETRRSRPQSTSDADWEVYQKLRASVQPLGRSHFVVDTSRDISPAITKILKEARH